MVERGEVVVVELDLRSLDHGEAETDEDVLDLAPHRGDQVQPAGRHEAGRPEASRRSRSRRRRRSSSAPCELGRALLDRSRSSACRTALASLPTGPRWLGRQRADRPQHAGELRLAAEIAHAQLLEVGARLRRLDRALGLLAELRQPRAPGWRVAASSRAPQARSAATLVPARACSYRAIVAAIATLSESGPPPRTGMRVRTVARSRAIGRQAVALGAQAQHDGRLRIDRAQLQLRRVPVERQQGAGEGVDPRPARRGPRED